MHETLKHQENITPDNNINNDYKEIRKNNDTEINDQSTTYNNDNFYNNVANLPRVVLATIFEYTSIDALFQASLVCSLWHEITSSENFWKKIFLSKWPIYNTLSDPPLCTKFSQNTTAITQKYKKTKKLNYNSNVAWKKAVYQQIKNKKTPIIFLQTITKTMAGFAGAEVPEFTQLSALSGRLPFTFVNAFHNPYKFFYFSFVKINLHSFI